MKSRAFVVLLPFFLIFGATANQANYHEGDLILGGNDKFVIENTTLTVHGNIILRGHAQFILKNAHLSIKQSYHEEFAVSLHERAQLIIENSVFDATFDIVLIRLLDQSHLLIVNSKVQHEIVLLDSARIEVTASLVSGLCAEEDGYRFNNRWGRAMAIIKDSKIHEITLGVGRYCVLSVSGLKPGSGINFTLSAADLKAGDIPYELRLSNCSIENCDFVVSKRAQVQFINCNLFQLACYDYAKVTVKDSIIAQMVLRFKNLWVAFGDLKRGYYKNWELKPKSGWLPCSLRLINSYVSEGWYLRLRGGNYEIDNSDLVRFRNEFDTRSSRYFLNNCCILEWLPWAAHGEITLQNCVIGTIQAPDNATSTLKGEFCVLTPNVSSFWGKWRNNSAIRRQFPIEVLDPSGNPASRVLIEILSPDGQLIQRAKTDAFGKTEISIIFDKTNFDKLYTLKVPQFDYVISFGLCSATPIRLPFSKTTCLDCTERLPQMANIRGQAIKEHTNAKGLAKAKPFLSWNSAMIISSRSERVAKDPNIDIISISAAKDHKFLYLRMTLRGTNPDVSGQRFVYEFYLLSPDWDSNHCYKINASRGTIERMTCDWSRVLDTKELKCIATNHSIEVAIPLSMLDNAQIIEIRAQTRIFPDTVTDFIQGFLYLD